MHIIGRIVSITWGTFILALVAATLPGLPYLVADGRLEAVMLITVTYGVAPVVGLSLVAIGVRRTSS